MPVVIDKFDIDLNGDNFILSLNKKKDKKILVHVQIKKNATLQLKEAEKIRTTKGLASVICLSKRNLKVKKGELIEVQFSLMKK